MNFLLGVVLLCGASFVGVKIAGNFRNELAYLHDFEKFLSLFEANLRFSRKPVSEFILDIECGFKPMFRQVLTDFLNREFQEKSTFEAEMLVKEFFLNIGHSDVDTQINLIKQTRCKLEELKQKCLPNQKKGELSIKLGIMCGVGLFIIVV